MGTIYEPSIPERFRQVKVGIGKRWKGSSVGGEERIPGEYFLDEKLSGAQAPYSYYAPIGSLSQTGLKVGLPWEQPRANKEARAFSKDWEFDRIYESRFHKHKGLFADITEVFEVKERVSSQGADKLSRNDKPLSDTTIANNTRLIMKFVNYISALSDTHPVFADEYDIGFVRINPWVSIEAIQYFLDNGAGEGKQFSDSTKRNYLSVILAMAKWTGYRFVSPRNLGWNVDYAKRIKWLVENIQAYQDKIIKDREARKVSPKKEAQQVSEGQAREVIARIREAGHEPEALIMEILLKYPYRAEVGTLKYITLDEYNKMKGQMTENYLVVGKRKMIISRSDYKTSATYGKIENEIKDKYLQKMLRKLIKGKEVGESVFGFETAQNTTQRLFYLTKKYNEGVSLGPAALVKIMLSNQDFKDLASASDYLRESSRIRGTSLSVLQDVYLHKASLEE